MTDILYRSAFALASDIKARRLSAVEVLDFFTDRVARINPGINDVWFNAATAGQGFLIIVLEDTGIIFMPWWRSMSTVPDPAPQRPTPPPSAARTGDPCTGCR